MNNVEYFKDRLKKLEEKKRITEDEAIEMSKLKNIIVVLSTISIIDNVQRTGDTLGLVPIGGYDGAKKLVETAKTSNEMLTDMFSDQEDDDLKVSFDASLRVASDKIKKKNKK